MEDPYNVTKTLLDESETQYMDDMDDMDDNQTNSFHIWNGWYQLQQLLKMKIYLRIF